MMHCPVATVPVQLSTPSLTVTLPVGVVGVIPVLELTLYWTVTACPWRDGSGLSDVIVVVVFALLMVTFAVAVALSTVALAEPAPAAFAVNVEVAVPFD